MKPTARPILFVSSAGSGLFNPMLVLATELARRGVPDLWFAADEYRRAEVERVDGLKFASLGEEIPELTPTSWDDETYRKITHRSRWKALTATALHTMGPSLRKDKYVRLDALVEETKPALMVNDTIVAFANRLAMVREIPFVLAVPFMPSNVLYPRVPKDFPVPNTGYGLKMSLSQRIANRLYKFRVMGLIRYPVIRKAFVEFARDCKQLGIPKTARGRTARLDQARLILCHTVPGVDYPIALPDKVRLVGSMIPPLPEAEPGAVSAWLDSHDSVVYMGLGTITRLTRDQVDSLVDVARKLDGQHHVLWKLPIEQQTMLPVELPPNLRVENWLPSQLDVLAHPNVKVFVNHGGGGGFNEGLYFGKPMVLYPLWVDCHDQAIRGQDAGVSLTLNHSDSIDIDDVVGKITRVLTEDSFRERAAHFRDLQLAAGGRETAASMILDVHNRLGD
jgi:polyene glycosyltransferase